MSTTYALRIREIRQKYKLTQTEFALEIGTTKNQLSKYETGFQEIPTKIIIAVCEKFNVSANWLLGIDREDTAAEVAKYNQIRNEVYRTVKAIDKANLSKEEKAVIINQLQKLVDNL